MAKAADEQQSHLLAQAEQIARDFDLSPDHVRQVTRHFVRQMSEDTPEDSAAKIMLTGFQRMASQIVVSGSYLLM